MMIRAARADDAARLTEIAFAAKRHWGYPDSWIERWREALTITANDVERGMVFAAVARDAIVGFGALAIERNDAIVEHLWVLPSWMGRGVGRALFEHAETLARERAVRRLRIEADPRAEGFYARMGAVTVGRIPAPMDGIERSLAAMTKNLERDSVT